MRGRPDKPSTPRSGWTYVLSTDRVARPPALGAGFTKATREKWQTIWAAPFATLYEPGDVVLLRRLMRMYENYDKSPTAANAGECRKLEVELGLTPISRLRLRWAVLRPESNGHAHPAMRATRKATADDDPRAVLQAKN